MLGTVLWSVAELVDSPFWGLFVSVGVPLFRRGCWVRATPEGGRPSPSETDPEQGGRSGGGGEEGRCGRTQRPSWLQLQGEQGEE